MDLRIMNGGCGVADDPGQSRSADGGAVPLPSAEVRRRIADHPCYSRAAHRYARLHLAVAPACNIQCHYCNRKYDCVNESRPGVTAEVLDPAEAIHRACAMAARRPDLSVVGIAGPGDPLANPERTFATLRGVRAALPGVRPCLSTNGLALARHLDTIAELGIDHVTITINAIDPAVGARIHPWVLWEGHRREGAEAAAILIREQLRGLAALAARGVLVKVNSVLIPGLNDAHLPEVARAIRARGAFLHNIMPLIAQPGHGTVFGLSGQPEPTAAELRAVRAACGIDMPLMTHCRRCRADAAGRLGEADDAPPAAGDPNDGATVRIAVASRDGRLIDQHFGHARLFRLYDVDAAGFHDVGERAVPPYCAGPDGCDADDDGRMGRALAALAGCAAVLCARVGREPRLWLEAAGVRPLTDHAWRPVAEALEAARASLVADREAAA